MRLTYFTGGPRERVLRAILDAGHHVERIYANAPERFPKVAPTLVVAREAGIPVRIVESKADLLALTDRMADRTLLSAGFNYIFSHEFIDNAKLVLNVHGTLLPHYAGARTLGWIIVNRETHSGVTVHKVDYGVDTGPILMQRSFELSPLETIRSLAERTYAFEPAVVIEALALVESGAAVFEPQLQGVRRWPDRTPKDSEIDPSRPLADLLPVILASDPQSFPAHFYSSGRKVCIDVSAQGEA